MDRSVRRGSGFRPAQAAIPAGMGQFTSNTKGTAY